MNVLLRRPALALAGAAIVLMLPSLLLGTMPSHSSMHNLTWAAQFSEQVRSGTLYPRWLADSYLGLGAPSFYFYPPLGFWVDALLSVATFDGLSTSYRLSITSALLLLASGFGMRAWLQQEGAGPTAALLGGIAYMAAPYHLADHYIRGAFAEFVAYTTLPFTLWALALVARRHAAGPPALALCYAALVMSHLPTALLISLVAIPAYVLTVAWRVRDSDRWFLPRCAAGFALGLGLAAVYLLPALTLQHAVSIDWLWEWGFKVEESFVAMPWLWDHTKAAPDMTVLICSISAAWLLAMLALLLARRTENTRSARLWMFVSLAAFILMSGLVPWFWTHVPLVSKVGFVWRLLIVVEFASVSALCLAVWPIRERLATRALVVAAVALVPGLMVLVLGIAGRIEYTAQGQPLQLQDAREYLPAGYPLRRNASYLDISLELVRDVPAIACLPAARVCRGEPLGRGGMRIETDSDVPTTVVLRRFFFPAWQLSPAAPLAASAPLQLVSFTAPPGRHDWRLERAMLPEEKTGWTISGVSLALVLAWALVSILVARRR